MARELITSKSKGFKLRSGGYSLGGGGGSSASSLNNLINLPTQLAFNRGDIPGTSYADIVAQALERAIPGTTVYNALLKEQSQAISRIRSEAEKSLEEGRKLRRLQAEAKAASTPGKTANDAAAIYNFWINEANKASQDGDAEYMAIALRNAGNARDLAEKRYETEGNKAESANKKAINAELKQVYNEWQTEDSVYKKKLREIDESYQKGVISGGEADSLLYQLNAVYSSTVEDRKKYLGELASLDINSMGGKDIQTLTESYSVLLDGKTDSTGKQTSPGLIEVSQKQADRISNADRFVDIVEPKLDKGYPTGEYQVTRRDRGAISSVDPTSGVFVRDDFGRYIFLNKEDSGNKAFYTGFTIAPDGSIIQLRTNEVDPDKQDGAKGLQVFVGDSDKPVSSYEGFIGNQAADQYNIFGKQDDDNFLRDEFKLNTEQIERGRTLTQSVTENLNKNFLQKGFDRVTQEGYNVLQGADKINKAITRQPFALGSDAVRKSLSYPEISAQQFAEATKKPQQQLPKQLAPAPAPKVVSPAVSQTPISPTYTSNASVVPSAAPQGTIKVPSGIKLGSTPGPINLGKSTTPKTVAGPLTLNDTISQALRGTANGGDIYVDKNEYDNAVKQYGRTAVDQAFTQGQFKKYKW